MRLTYLFLLTTAILLTLVSTLLARSVLGDWRTVTATERGLRAMTLTQLAMKIAEKASFERGPSNVVMGENEPRDPAKRKRMLDARAASDQAITDALAAIGTPISADHIAAVAQIEKTREALKAGRAEIERVAALPFSERSGEKKNIIRIPVGKMFGVIDVALETVTILSADAERIYPELSPPLVSARQAAELREYAGRLGSQLTTPIGAQSPLGPEERRDIPLLIGRIEQLRQLIEVSARANTTEPPVKAAIAEMNRRYFEVGLRLINQMTAEGSESGQYSIDLATFVARYVPEMASIVTLRDTLFEVTRAGAAASHVRAARDLHINALIGVLVLMVEIAVLLLILRRVVRPLLSSTASIVAIAEGRLDTPVVVSHRGDEIGDMQRAIAALKQTSVEKRRLEQERNDLIDRLRQHSNIDFLTNLLNRRAFAESVQQQLALARRNNWPVALIMFDLDHFKQVNDRHGHAIGDTVLAGVAAIASKLFRAADTLARHGGEEFIALLTNCNEADAEAFSNRVRTAIEAASFMGAEGKEFKITASFGVASAPATDVTDINAFTRSADQALYRAKADGRNRVFRASMLDA